MDYTDHPSTSTPLISCIGYFFPQHLSPSRNYIIQEGNLGWQHRKTLNSPPINKFIATYEINPPEKDLKTN